jgi:hypothetical protein
VRSLSSADRQPLPSARTAGKHSAGEARTTACCFTAVVRSLKEQSHEIFDPRFCS